jgi:hypothetical protein
VSWDSVVVVGQIIPIVIHLPSFSRNSSYINVGQAFKDMRQTRFTILLTLISICSYGQQYNFDLDKVKFKGLGLETTKKIIIEKFGQGKRIETNYECGFFALDNSKAPYYQLVFNDFKFIGSDKDKFYLHIVDFDLKGKIKIDYGDKILNGLTTKDEFIEMFGEIAKKHFDNPDNQAIILIADGRDDGARFTFKDGRLVKSEYWTPC